MDDDMHDGNVDDCNADCEHSHDSSDHAHDASEVAADGACPELPHRLAGRMQMLNSIVDRLKRILFSFVRIFLVFILQVYLYFLFSL
jgi:hypothetical protein